MKFNLNSVGIYSDITDPTIDGHPVISASILHAGFSSIATVSTAVDTFQHLDCRGEWMARRFILSKLDGFLPEMSAIQAHGVTLLAKYGPFVLKAQRDAITANTAFEDWHDDYNDKKLRGAIDKVVKRISDTLIEANIELATPDSEVKEAQLTDAQVAAGIRYITGKHADRASMANDEGWGPTVSDKGHWANAMLETEPAAAIHVARQFIGGYTRQLREGGII